jgi:hypothetical protein
MWAAATVDGPIAMVAGISLTAAGTGAVFVVASATALGAAVASSIAATSPAGTSPAGFSRGFTTAALVAAATALVTLAVAPGRQTPSSPAGDAP